MEFNKELDANEIRFCELFVDGPATYAGNAAKCYREAFGREKGYDSTKSGVMARRLLSRPEITAKIRELEAAPNPFETKDSDNYTVKNLMSIIDEMTNAQYFDRKGQPYSPHGCRAVAVNALKLLQDMQEKKDKTKITVEGPTGVVFNVIVPDSKPKTEDDGGNGE